MPHGTNGVRYGAHDLGQVLARPAGARAIPPARARRLHERTSVQPQEHPLGHPQEEPCPHKPLAVRLASIISPGRATGTTSRGSAPGIGLTYGSPEVVSCPRPFRMRPVPSGKTNITCGPT